ncbi:hypothetical protein [Actinomadura meridiana]|uniref:hypothetical protein n=1 Tax=Actinomadura meridiana TaxID=559626 RepID=UPI0031F049F4
MRTENVVKLAAAANDTDDLKAFLVFPDGETSARISHVRLGYATDVTVVLDLGLPRFAWTMDHGTIAAVEDIEETLGAVRHRLVMRDAACRP